jgi:hypothetical protein
MLNMVYYSELTLFIDIIPEHIDEFLPSWQEFKNAAAVINRVLQSSDIHEHPLPLSHYFGM